MPTLRQEIIALLAQGEYSAKDVSRALSLREKEVYEHLEHIARSARSQKEKLIIKPSTCRECGFIFDDRRRFSKPGRCPRCRSERISEPRFHIEVKS